MRLVLGLIVTLFTAGGVFAQCSGADLRSSLSDAERQELDTRVAATPYATGNHWLATRGDMRIHLIGTVHLDDPRLDAPTERLRPLIEEAAALLLEMTPADEQALQQDLVSAPDKLLLTDTTLPEIMSEEAWAALSEAVTARGLPPFMAAKFQPWYLSMLLSVPPCATATLTEGAGLDKRLARIAEGAEVPMHALESYETIFAMFTEAPMSEQIAMLESALVAPDEVEDMFATLLASYVDETTAEGWEISRILARRSAPLEPGEIDAVFDAMADGLLTDRNRAWIPVILDAAGTAEGRPVVVAFGAAHLAGDTGVLQLLTDEGFELPRQPF